MSGISYDLSKIRGVALDVDGVLSPSVISIDNDGQPVRMMNVKDAYAIYMALKSGLKIAIISGSYSPEVETRYSNLGIDNVIMNASNKLPVLKSWMESEGLKPEEVAYMGDDIPDLKCMRVAGLPCAPHDAAHEVRETAIYVSKFSGGYGCVRDLIEQILRIRGQWLANDFAFNW